MSGADDQDRYERERSFHDERFTHETRQRADKYYSVEAGALRYRTHLANVAPDRRLLEYGCGSGSSVWELAQRGVAVTGIDLSPVGVEAATAEAERLGVSASFRLMNAEALDLPDRSFDVVCGTGILHHLDLDRALAEVQRVLHTDGWALFLEPLGTNPSINLYRRLTPSLRTPDEHPLVSADFALMRERFDDVRVEWFDFLGLTGVLWRRVPGGDAIVRALHRVDQWLFRSVPPTRKLAWVTVVRLAGPHSC